MPSVTVKLASGRVVQVPLASFTAPVLAVKVQLEDVAAGASSQRLVFVGVELDDARSLGSYGVADGTVLHLLPPHEQQPAEERAPAASAIDTAAAAAAPVPAIALLPADPLLTAESLLPAQGSAAGMNEGEDERRQLVEAHRRQLLGARFHDIEPAAVLGVGCNGAVLDAVVRGVPVAAKVMFNYGQCTTLVADLHTTEFRFLQQLPPHRNVVAVLGIIAASPITAELVALLPDAAREAAVQVNHRTGRTRYRATTGLLLERLPLTLEAYVAERADGLGEAEVAVLGLQVVEALAHLEQHGIVHGDVKLNNLMVDPATTPWPRVVLVDFGCAVLRGPQPADMDEHMQVHATEATNFSLGNHAHLAPEVLVGLARKAALARGSTDRAVIPLAKQEAFAAGVALYEVALGLEHPLLDYPAVGNSADGFAAIDVNDLRDVAGAEFADVVHGLLEFDAARRLSLSDALRRLRTAAPSSLPPGTGAGAVAAAEAAVMAQPPTTLPAAATTDPAALRAARAEAEELRAQLAAMRAKEARAQADLLEERRRRDEQAAAEAARKAAAERERRDRANADQPRSSQSVTHATAWSAQPAASARAPVVFASRRAPGCVGVGTVIQATRDPSGDAGFAVYKETLAVASVNSSRTAYRNGLRPGAVITHVNGQRVSDWAGYCRLAKGRSPFDITIIGAQPERGPDFKAAVVEATRDLSGDSGFTVTMATLTVASVNWKSVAFRNGLRKGAVITHVQGTRVFTWAECVGGVRAVRCHVSAATMQRRWYCELAKGRTPFRLTVRFRSEAEYRAGKADGARMAARTRTIRVERDHSGKAGYDVFMESVAFQNGLRNGNTIVAVNGRTTSTWDQYKQLAFGQRVFTITVIV